MKKKITPLSISPQQKKFCDEYLIDFNPLRAYRAAKYKAKTDQVAHSSASEILKNPKCKVYIASILRERQEEYSLLVSMVIEERKRLAFSSIQDVVEQDEDGFESVKKMSDLPRAYANGIKSIAPKKVVHFSKGEETTVTITTKVEMHPKDASLKALEQMLGLDSDLNSAIATLRKYGKKLIIEGSKWQIEDVEVTNSSANPS